MSGRRIVSRKAQIAREEKKKAETVEHMARAAAAGREAALSLIATQESTFRQLADEFKIRSEVDEKWLLDAKAEYDRRQKIIFERKVEGDRLMAKIREAVDREKITNHLKALRGLLIPNSDSSTVAQALIVSMRADMALLRADMALLRDEIKMKATEIHALEESTKRSQPPARRNLSVHSKWKDETYPWDMQKAMSTMYCVSCSEIYLLQRENTAKNCDNCGEWNKYVYISPSNCLVACPVGECREALNEKFELTDEDWAHRNYGDDDYLDSFHL
ncbi:MAG: hypothetical protein Hyperionvirus5_73 [Hyperionvirus sp.]|uniref:Uncharacterized protein n=1 Tax=Hyperionvirus sp. TaxID=2487770 RepID=A0A3G5A7P5_9VIRU|nr:MAG: hypothetical protein Hyperionvirus5_73 [Hyperionvirus sp.]